ncbi:MAG: hypothetical protein MJ145_02820 [Clostridia bacterium]|nr:hypothetical protein [Clostridia bacterium]
MSYINTVLDYVAKIAGIVADFTIDTSEKLLELVGTGTKALCKECAKTKDNKELLNKVESVGKTVAVASASVLVLSAVCIGVSKYLKDK